MLTASPALASARQTNASATQRQAPGGIPKLDRTEAGRESS
jgi:hypothetical protein